MKLIGDRSFSRDQLRNPDKEYTMNYGWAWNAPITKDGIDKRLGEMKDAGIRGVYVLPMPKDFRPERLRTFLDPEYLSDEFFELISYAYHKAADMGMELWVYDEGGWPSGGACYNTLRAEPNAVLKVIRHREITLVGDVRYTPCENFVALFLGKTRLPDNYIPQTKVNVTEYYIENKVDFGNRVDNSCTAVTEEFIRNTYEKYKDAIGDLFGERMPLIFTDEPGLLRESIGYNEFEVFEKEYGYDLRDYIYVIDNAGLGLTEPREIQARIDHSKLIGKLFRENTCMLLHDWCEKNGVYYSGHLDLDNRPWGGVAKGYYSHLDLLRTFHVPGIDVIWNQIGYPYDGRSPLDDETEGYGFFPRLASSAARQRGRNLALSETFSVYGDALTPDEFRYALNYQIMRGINVINPLAITYGKARLATLMMRPQFVPEKPGYLSLRELNRYFERLCYLARLGEAEGDTALYHPAADYCADFVTSEYSSASYKALGTELEEKNVPFDIIDDNGILEAEDTKDGLRIGSAIYRHIAVPECKYMPEEVKKKIEPYLGVGTSPMSFKSDKLRVMTRKLDTGRLYFIFNEGEPTVSEAIDLSESGYKYSYLLSQRDGEVHTFNGQLQLTAGEIAVIFATDEVLDAISDIEGECIVIGGFAPVSYRRFTIDHFGVSMKPYSGAPVLDESFSGEVTYEADYTLPFEPLSGERYKIALDGFSVSARVEIGRADLSLGLSPMEATVDGEQLDRTGRIRITVANTAANEIAAKQNVIHSYPKAEVGGYSEKLAVLESRRPEISFGEVRLTKLI